VRAAALQWLEDGRKGALPDGWPEGVPRDAPRSSLPNTTFGAHNPLCLAQLQAVHRDSLPFRHVPDVGYVTHQLATLLHKGGTQGSCAQIVRYVSELKWEDHYKAELARARLMVLVQQVEEKVRAGKQGALLVSEGY
jgi:hypothetical protein